MGACGISGSCAALGHSVSAWRAWHVHALPRSNPSSAGAPGEDAAARGEGQVGKGGFRVEPYGQRGGEPVGDLRAACRALRMQQAGLAATLA